MFEVVSISDILAHTVTIDEKRTDGRLDNRVKNMNIFIVKNVRTEQHVRRELEKSDFSIVKTEYCERTVQYSTYKWKKYRTVKYRTVKQNKIKYSASDSDSDSMKDRQTHKQTDTRTDGQTKTYFKWGEVIVSVRQFLKFLSLAIIHISLSFQFYINICLYKTISLQFSWFVFLFFFPYFLYFFSVFLFFSIFFCLQVRHSVLEVNKGLLFLFPTPIWVNYNYIIFFNI